MAKAFVDKDLSLFNDIYTDNSILMAEYQPTMRGEYSIMSYYKNLFQRLDFNCYEKSQVEIIDYENIIIEIGHFNRGYDSISEYGKYWNIWAIEEDGALKLQAEAFGFFHPIKDPTVYNINLPMQNIKDSKQNIPLMLKAYNALMEKAVTKRDGILRSEFFTDDALFHPFADSTKTGMAVLKPYLIEYNSGDVLIDSIDISTYDFIDLGKDLLEFNKFNVYWRTEGFEGSTSGKGIRIWQLLEDNSYKIHREIGLHNHN